MAEKNDKKLLKVREHGTITQTSGKMRFFSGPCRPEGTINFKMDIVLENVYVSF